MESGHSGSWLSQPCSSQQHVLIPPRGFGGVSRPDEIYCIILSASSGSSLEISSQLDMPRKQRVVPWKHPYQIPEPPQMAPCNLKELLELPPSVWNCSSRNYRGDLFQPLVHGCSWLWGQGGPDLGNFSFQNKTNFVIYSLANFF